MKLEQYLLVIQDFIKDYLTKSHTDGFVLGVSGGIDSALVLALAVQAVGKDKVYGLIMPCESDPSDAKDAIELCEKFGIKYEIYNLYNSYEALKNIILRKEYLL